MSQQHSSVEIGNVAPALRDDLKFTLQKHGDETCYMLEDPLNARFFRVGIPEYVFLSLFDGKTTIKDAVALTAQNLGQDAFTEREAAAICKWVIDNQLAFTGASSQVDRLVEVSRKKSVQKRMQWINPILIRAPLMRPDRVVTELTRTLGWLVSRQAFVIWLCVVAFALYQLITNWGEFRAASHDVLSPNNRWWLLGTWIALKFIHEVAHAVTCKRYGGDVHEAGFLFIILAPIPYVDVTSSWRFPSKWPRIFTAAAGMYAEIFCAAIATIIWFQYDGILIRQLAYNTMLTATVMTLLFNANFLMRFDGYYIFSDLVEIPNLYPLGQQFTKHLAGKFFFGGKKTLPAWSPTKSAIIKTYGVAAFFWRIVVFASIIMTASTLFSGVGVLLAIISISLWIGMPLYKLAKDVFDPSSFAVPNMARFAITSAISAAAIAGFLLLPEPGGVRAPAVVKFAPMHVVRAPHDGFVRDVRVEGGETTTTGQPIANIENFELRNEAVGLQFSIQQSQLRTRYHREKNEIAAVQAEQESLAALISEFKQRRDQLAASSLTAPAQGKILTPDVQRLPGSFVQEGDELVSIGEETNKKIELSIAQEDVEFFREHVGSTVKAILRSPGHDAIECTLVRVEPRGSQALSHPALSASADGPVAVQRAQADSSNSAEHSQQEWEYVEPRFVGVAELSAEQSTKLRAGQTATVRLDSSRGTMGQFLYRTISRWVRTRLDQSIG